MPGFKKCETVSSVSIYFLNQASRTISELQDLRNLQTMPGPSRSLKAILGILKDSPAWFSSRSPVPQRAASDLRMASGMSSDVSLDVRDCTKLCPAEPTSTQSTGPKFNVVNALSMLGVFEIHWNGTNFSQGSWCRGITSDD